MLYKGSKLEEDLEQLKTSINKTEHQKAIEPYQEKISRLERKILEQRDDIENLYMACQDFIKSIERDYLTIIVNLDEPKAYIPTFDSPKLQVCHIKQITVPIKQNLKECFINQVRYYENKYRNFKRL